MAVTSVSSVQPLIKLTVAERQAAERLGSVYLYLSSYRALPLDIWAIPTNKQQGIGHNALYAARSHIYGTDTARQNILRRSGYKNSYDLYKEDYDMVMPRIISAIHTFTLWALSAEGIELAQFLRRLESEPGLPERLSAASKSAVEKAGGLAAKDDEIWDAMESRVPPSGYYRFNPETKKAEWVTYGVESRFNLNERKLNAMVKKRIMLAVHEKKDDVLSTLCLHPHGLSIIAAYNKDAVTGNQYSAGLVKDAIRAVEDFYTELVDASNANHVLRYPFLIVGGIKLLGLHEVPGLKEYVVSIGQVLTRSMAERLISFAAIAVGCLALVFMGPVGAFVIATADLALAGAGMSLAYIREREQELGAQASTFKVESEQFAGRSGYLDTALAGAAAFLSALAFFKAALGLKEMLKARPKGINEALKPAKSDALKNQSDVEFLDPMAKQSRQITRARRIEDVPLDGETANVVVRNRKTEIAPPDKNKYFLTAPTKDDQTRAIRQAMRDDESRTIGRNISGPGKSGGRVAQEGTSEATGIPKSSERMNVRGLPVRSSVSEAETVPARQLRKELRARLQKQIDWLLDKMAELQAEKSVMDKEIASIRNRIEIARKSGKANNVAPLQEQFDELIKQRGTGNPFATDYLKKRELLRGTERDYYEYLTNAASQRSEYETVRFSKVNDFFLPVQDERWVEHIYPRSKIFMSPGFENLEWQQQIFLFNYRKNLMPVSAEFNRLRGTQPYGSLKREFWSKFIKDEASIAKLSTLENEVKTDIEKLIQRPRDNALWREFGYFDQ